MGEVKAIKKKTLPPPLVVRPVLKRENYFNDADYAAALIREKNRQQKKALFLKTDSTCDGGGYPPSPCIINGVEYPSINAAATALGVKRNYISFRINSPGHPGFSYVEKKT
ncbi:MAG: hypothetical protein ACD_84C00043G0002 [uncultured bacterium]|nr:MAG: hypothetical protein ACD_84C00043G0002 [uncultured bacterium]